MSTKSKQATDTPQDVIDFKNCKPWLFYTPHQVSEAKRLNEKPKPPMPKHTPTPFQTIDNRLSEVRDRVSTHNESTAYTCELIDDAIKANARAVNSHEELLDALRRSKRVVAESCGYNDGSRFHTDLLNDIEAAIAKAEGK